MANTVQVDNMLDEINNKSGAVSILVNNAGTQIEKTIIETTDADWDTLMGANARGVCLTAAGHSYLTLNPWRRL